MRDPEHHLGVLVFISIVAIAGMLLGGNTPTAALTQAVPSVQRATVIITGLDLNDELGQDIEVLTNQHLSSLASGIVHAMRPSTNEPLPPVTRLITFSTEPGPLKVALSPFEILNSLKL